MDTIKQVKISTGWLTMSAASLLLATQVSVAAEGDKKYGQKETQAQQHEQTQGQQEQEYQQQARVEQQGQQQEAELVNFEQLDEDNDGALRWQDIESEYQEPLQQAQWDEQQVHDLFDANGDQEFSREEYDSFQTALRAQMSDDQQTAQAQQSGQAQQSAQIPEFDQIDQDGDGQAQWQDIELELDQQLQQANMDEQKVMEQFDQNGDQALDQQEYESFQTALSEQQVGGAQQTAEIPQFDQIDQDGDGQAQWQDIEMELEQQLQQANMDEQQVMEQFDQNNDQALDQREYDSFQTALQAQTQMAAAQPGQQQDQQAQQDQQFDQQQDQQAQRDQAFDQQQDQQQQAQAGQQAQELDTTLLSMSVDQITQADVVNSRGEQIGSVNRVVRDESTGELALVVRSGGILGLGASSILVSLEEVSQMGENQLLWDTMLSQEEIADMPGFDENQYTEISESEYATLGEATRG